MSNHKTGLIKSWTKKKKNPNNIKWVFMRWRPRPESNRGARICSPLRNHSATRPRSAAAPLQIGCGAGDGFAPRLVPIAKDAAILQGRTIRKSILNFVQPKFRLGLCKVRSSLLYGPPSLRQRSLIAQPVEQSTVNRSVAGSSPAQGANSRIFP